MAKQTIKIEISDVTRLELSTDLEDETIVVGTAFDGSNVAIHLSPPALLKLEAFLARANVEQAKRQSSH